MKDSLEVCNTLQAQFSTGVRLPELRSIAAVLCQLVELRPPSREANRNCAVLMRWFVANWTFIRPLITSIELRDRDGRTINRAREMTDMGIFG
jgi:hypothetical protein